MKPLQNTSDVFIKIPAEHAGTRISCWEIGSTELSGFWLNMRRTNSLTLIYVFNVFPLQYVFIMQDHMSVFS